jgi:hypothetical protein
LNYNNSLSLWNFHEYFLKCRVWTSALLFLAHVGGDLLVQTLGRVRQQVPVAHDRRHQQGRAYKPAHPARDQPIAQSMERQLYVLKKLSHSQIVRHGSSVSHFDARRRRRITARSSRLLSASS